MLRRRVNRLTFCLFGGFLPFAFLPPPRPAAVMTVFDMMEVRMKASGDLLSLSNNQRITYQHF